MLSIIKNDDKKPLISFIITFYNLPLEMLQVCIDSILKLSLSDLEREIIVVDDGADISPLNTLLAYHDKVLYIHQHNQGLSVARNTGINNANGKYIQFMDGDDYLVTSAYEHCLDIARYHKADIVTFLLTSKQATEKGFSAEEILSGTEYLRHHNLRASACGYIFKKHILGNLRFTPQLLHEDEEFTPLLFLRSNIIIETTAHAYYYRKRNNSITHNRSKEWTQKRLNDYAYIINHLRVFANNSSINERLALNRRIAQMTMAYIYNVIHLTHDAKEVDKRIEELYQNGLFPLPNIHYTRKYDLFRKMISTSFKRRILLKLIK